jgi:hypothetical protein
MCGNVWQCVAFEDLHPMHVASASLWPLCGLFVASLWPLWEEGKKKSEREEAQADRWSKVFATHTMARPTR